ncbi:M20 family metallopeptidase [Vaginisenegalia massiliensis]|uniref:M20 family metallopeptidase n=1 Tax=Vaginisenegalia massiliensis TaxID=2058294 RepID=UPI000F53C46B|nr:M20 family metallopeptidase [Vaginisenegalia massiliensis]
MEYVLTKNVQEQAVEMIKHWVSYPSVLDETATDTPFGAEIQRCLEAALSDCEKLGFRTYLDPEGYYGYAEIGEGTESLAILCHLDVVPAGDVSEWTSDPFKAEVRDGKLYGRGTQDDKGPTVAALFAVKALVEQGKTFNKRIRFIFGTDEENLWRCLNRYVEKEEKATYGFAPDAEFPLTYAEKGLLQSWVKGPGSQDLVLNNNGAFNVVPDKAVYQGDKLDQVKETLASLGYDLTEKDGGLVVLGKSVHSKDADQGINAVTRLAEALSSVYSHPMLDFLQTFKQDVFAKAIFGDVEDEASGKLTVNIAKLIITPEESKIGVDFRIPVTADKEALAASFASKAEEFGLTYEEYDYLASLYVPLDSELVTTLLSVYRELTGDMTEPISSGGATFARTMENCVAFGAITDDVEVTFHQVDECMPLKNIYESMEIYAHAIEKLACK